MTQVVVHIIPARASPCQDFGLTVIGHSLFKYPEVKLDEYSFSSSSDHEDRHSLPFDHKEEFKPHTSGRMRAKTTARKSTTGTPAPRRRRQKTIRLSPEGSEPEPTQPTRLLEGQFSAWIRIGQRELEVYEQKVHTYSDRTVISGYIASEEGRSFTVHWKDAYRTYNTCSDVYIDGVDVGCQFIYSKRYSTKEQYEESGIQSIVSLRTSEEFIQSLMFSQITTTDDDAYMDKPPAENLGQIEILVRKCKSHWDRKRKRSKKELKKNKKSKYNMPDLSEPVHETSVKATGHRFGLGAKRYKPRMEDSSSDSDDSGYEDKPPFQKMWSFSYPHIVFIFKYRARERLQADGIIPPDIPAGRSTPEVQEMGHSGDNASDFGLEDLARSSPPASNADESDPDEDGSDRDSRSQRPPSRVSATAELEYIDDPLLVAPRTEAIEEAPPAEDHVSASKDASQGCRPLFDWPPNGSASMTSQDAMETESLQSPQIAENIVPIGDVNDQGENQNNFEGTPSNDGPSSVAGPCAGEQGNSVTIKEEELEGDPRYERIRRLREELELATQELQLATVKKEIKLEDEELLKVKEEVSMFGRYVIDLTALE